jgi:hypothetical protein
MSHRAAFTAQAGDGRYFAAAGLALAVAAAVARLVPHGPLRLVLVLAFTVAGPGCALVGYLWIRDRVLGLAMAFTASLSLSAIVATGMVWGAWWHPAALNLAVVALTGAAALARVLNWTPIPPPPAKSPWTPGETSPATGLPPADTEADPAGLVAATGGPAAVGHPSAAGGAHAGGGESTEGLPHGGGEELAGWVSRRERRRRVVVGSGVLSPTLLVVSAGLWAVTVARSGSAQIGFYGMTAGLGVPFVASLTMTCLAFGVELFGRVRRSVLVAGVGAVAVQIFGTAPLLLAQPEYAWTYKHFGVVELIQHYGGVIDPTDIYQEWPAFFASVAQVSTVAGVEPIRFATWSSLFFALLDAVMLAAAARALTTDRRVVFLTVFLFECCLWVDQNYFSPQAFAYALSLGFFAILLHSCRGEPTGRWPGWIGRLQGVLVRDSPPAAQGVAKWGRLVAIALVFFAITAAHQLTPYLLLFGLGLLTVLGFIRPYPLVALLAVVAGGYFLPRLSGVSSQYHLFDGFDLFKNASGNSTGWGSDAQRFSALVCRILAFTVWGSTLVAVWLNRRALGRVAIGLVLGFSPFLLLGLQNYGGEAIYRVFLFSLPWCALLAAGWWGKLRPTRVRGVVSGLLCAAFALAALQGLQGQFALHVVPAADIRAARYLAAQAPAGSTMVMVAAAFPARLTANYGDVNPGRSVDPSIVDEPEFRLVTLDSSELPAVESWAEGYGGTETFLVVTDQMVKEAEFFGDLTPASLQALRDALNSSDSWSVYYRGPGITIYRLEPES